MRNLICKKGLAVGGGGLVILSFVFGAVVSEFQISPVYDFFGRAFSAASALKIKTLEYNKERNTDLWVKNRRGTEARVTLCDKEKAFDGYTFCISGHAQEAVLMDMQGRLVHRWAMPFRQAWSSHPHLRLLVDPAYIAWRQAVLMPNGDIIVVYIGQGAAPWGYGLARLDKDSNVLWTINDHFHHDVTIGEDGNIYSLVHRISNEKIEELPEVKQPYFRDSIVVISSEGKVLKRIDLLDAMIEHFKATGEEAKLYSFVYRRNGDFLHTNTARYIPEAFAEKNPMLKTGQILISYRSMSMLAALDIDSGEVVWTQQGPWKMQHDPDMLPNGNLLIFDNRGRRVVGGKSAVMEYNPVKEEVVWLYTGTRLEHDFDSNIRGMQQKLPNGNVLLTESQGGRLLEVTPEKELVWEWVSPYKSSPDQEYTAAVMTGVRFAKEDLPFLKEK